jgi:uncharacterized protein (TIGR03435 family)
LLILLGIGATVIPIRSQTKPSFEVISVKPTPSGSLTTVLPPQGDRLNWTGTTLKNMMNVVYQDPATRYPLEVFGGPDWMDSARYDVQAKADCSRGIISREQQMLMIQSLLEDRFQLKAHVETRDMPIYTLVVGKDGPKLKASADQTPPPLLIPASQLCNPTPEPLKLPALPPLPPPGTDPSKVLSFLPRGVMWVQTPQQDATITLQGGALGVDRLLNTLKLLIGRQVIDKTGLTDLFDISLKFSSDGLSLPGQPSRLATSAPEAADPAPSLFSAIQDLGLKLEPARGPVQVVVIDSVRKPSEN